jgi:hypothetical protein
LSKQTNYGQFIGLSKSLAVPGGSYASEAFNVRLEDGAIRPAWGYRNLCPKTYGFDNINAQVYGWQYVVGYDNSYAPLRFWQGVFYNNGQARPFMIDPVTFIRTEIKNGVTSLNLGTGEWAIVPFFDRSYWINSSNSESPYYNVIGDATSFVSLRGDYAAPSAPTAAATKPSNFDAAVIRPAAHTVDGTVATAVAVDATPNFYLAATITNANVTGNATVTLAIPAGANSASRDWSKVNMIGSVFATSALNSPMRFSLPDVKITLINSTGTRFPCAASGGDQNQSDGGAVQYFLDETTASQRTDIRYIEVTYTITTACGGGAADKFIVWSIGRGFTDTRALAGIRDGSSLKYGVSYYNSVNGVESDLTGVLLDVASQGSYRNGQLPTRFFDPTMIMDMPDVSAAATISFAASGDAVVDKARIYYQAGDGEYHLMGEVSDAAGSFQVYQTETQALALPTYRPVQLNGSRLIGGFPFKAFMFWLYKGGYRNIAASRVGNPLLLGQSTDDTGDISRGAWFTMADGFNDEPIGGTQAGDVAFFVGSKGVYATRGDYPSTLAPISKMPYSKGCAGKRAFAPVSIGEVQGLAYVDTNGEGLWFYSPTNVYVGDSGGRPIELSAMVRGEFASWLRDDQIDKFGKLSLSDICVSQTVDDDSILVTLGNRAMIYTKPSLVDGNRHWIRREFALTHPDGPLAYGSVVTTGTTAGTFSTVARGGSGANWSTGSFTNDPTDGGYAEVTQPSGTYSNYFQIIGLKPASSIPPSATLTSVVIRVWWTETGAGVGADSDVRIMLDGAVYGANIAVGTVVPGTLNTFDYTVNFGTMGLTPMDITNGRLGIRLSVAGSGGANAFVRVGGFQVITTATQTTAPVQVITPFCGDFLATSNALGAGNAFTIRPYSGVPGDGQDPFATVAATATTKSYFVKGIRPGIAVPTDAQITAITARVYAYGGTEADGCAITESKVQIYKGGATSGSNLTTSAVIGFENSDPRDYTVDPTLWTAREINSGLFGVLVEYTGGATGNNRKVYLEAIQISVTFQTGDAEFGISAGVGYRFVGSRTDARQLWGVRYTGHVDEIGWDSTWNRHIDGSYQDGGYVMPDGFYQTGETIIGRSEIARGQVIRDGAFSGETMSITTNEFTVPMARVCSSSGWALFGSTGRGQALKVGVTVPETHPGVLTMTIQSRQLSENR